MSGSWRLIPILPLVLAAAVAAGQLASAGTVPPAPSKPSTQPPRQSGKPAAVRFPLRVDPNKRYLVDRSGKPFLMIGDAAWSLAAQLGTDEVDVYLEDRRRRGFNTILFNLLEHKFADDPPRNTYGEAPFTRAGDFGTPNERYFRRVDATIRKALQRGILVLLFPAYAGLGGGSQGWWTEMRANGVEKLRAFGRYVGTRYKRFPNVIWVQSGDFTPPAHEHGLMDAVAEGIRSVDSKLQTFHGGRGSSALGYRQPRPAWLGVNTIYTSDDDVVSYARIEYSRSRLPFFLIEARYENQPGFTAHTVRQQAYQAILAGASGAIMGNQPVWSFAPEWRQALGSPGAVGKAHLGRLLHSLPWWKLQPDAGNRLLTSGIGSGGRLAVAARARDGTLAVVYAPTPRRITLDLRRLRGPRVRARWYDPTTGRYRPPASLLRTGTPRAFRMPPRNAAGDGDMVLVLTSAK